MFLSFVLMCTNRAQKTWCMLVSCTIRVPNTLSRSTKYRAPRLNILQLKLFEFKSITIWNIIRRISLFNLPHVLRIEKCEQVRFDKTFVYLTFACCTNKAISQRAVTIRDNNVSFISI